MAFEPRLIINGGKLRETAGKTISIFVNIEDASGQIIRAKTTDGLSVRINLPEIITARPGDWIEVIGAPAGPDAIRAKEVIQFYKGEEEFDVEAHNMLVQFINLRNDFYQQG